MLNLNPINKRTSSAYKITSRFLIKVDNMSDKTKLNFEFTHLRPNGNLKKRIVVKSGNIVLR